MMNGETYANVHEKCVQLVDGTEFTAQGKEAMEIQERMFARYLHGVNVKTISANILAGIFASMAFALVMFGPEGRQVEIVIFSVAFILLSVGIAGFTQFKWRSVGLNFEAAQNAALRAGNAEQIPVRQAPTAEARGRRRPSPPAHTTTVVGGRGNGVAASDGS